MSLNQIRKTLTAILNWNDMKSIKTIKESIDSDDDTATDLQGNVLKGIDNCADTAHKARLLFGSKI